MSGEGRELRGEVEGGANPTNCKAGVPVVRVSPASRHYLSALIFVADLLAFLPRLACLPPTLPGVDYGRECRTREFGFQRNHSVASTKAA